MINNVKDTAVFIQKGPDPYQNTIKVLEQLSLPDLKGKSVLLKPNAGRLVGPGLGVTTAPQVVAAACDFFVSIGAVVTVGESTIVGVKPLDCLESTGIAAVVRARNLPVLDLDERPACVTKVQGQVVDHLKICGAVPEFDYIVSIPVMKTHMHCQVTLSLKNMKGCLRGREKVRLHQLPAPTFQTQEKPLDLAIADLATVLSPDLAIIDGSICMEGVGPSGGDKKSMDMVLASTDFLNADFVAAALMGFGKNEVAHLRLTAARLGHAVGIDTIKIHPANWKDYIDPFARPADKISLSYPDITIKDCESCSACVSTVMMFLKNYYASLGDYLPLELAIGKAHDDLGPDTICIGNCTKKVANGGTFIQGCPPVASVIMQAIIDRNKKS